MTAKEILVTINKYIVEENGKPVTGKDLFIDSGLDSLGTTIVILTIDSEFNIAEGLSDSAIFEFLDIQNLTVKRLVHLCKS